MEVLTLPIQEDLDVPDATFATPDVTTFCRLDELGLVVVGAVVLVVAALLVARAIWLV